VPKLTKKRIIWTALCALGPVATLSACAPDQAGPARITLRARAPERGNWSPREIHVERGKPVTIVVRNVDIATHSFYLPALSLNTGPLKPGETKEVTFTPEFEGEYLFLCAVWCSDYHMYETGWLIVE
jgi:heme/copper-type cytochrome/quinol oxidase subunit 2